MTESATKKRFDLNIKKTLNSEKTEKNKVKNVFGEESDSDDGEQSSSKKLSAAEMFNKKYALNKAQRLLEKTVNENPSIFEYDEIYDQLKAERCVSKEHQKADEEKKPKYVDSIMKAHKRRELQKLIHDEHVYKKEREAEGEQFTDKEAYVTESYRKKILERNAFREEVERQDALDDMVNVKDQKMWQQAFQRQLLDNISRAPIKEENDALKKENLIDIKIEIKQEALESNENVSSDEKKTVLDEVQIEKHKKHSIENERNSFEKSKANNENNDSKQESKKYKFSSKNYEKSIDYSRDKKFYKAKTHRTEELDEIAKRMKKIRQILAQRNTYKEIKEAKKRFFERQKNETVIPPLF